MTAKMDDGCACVCYLANASLREAQVAEAINGGTNVCCANGQGRGSDCKLGTYSLVAWTLRRLDIQRIKKGHKALIS